MGNGIDQKELNEIKELVCNEVDARASMLIEASHAIHENPELNFEEHFAHELLTGILEDEDLSPTRKAYDLDTAFEANIEGTGPTVAVLCEYDALPDIGHACGHNIIATAGLGAGLAAATVAKRMGGSLRILGTPAEEGGGGKKSPPLSLLLLFSFCFFSSLFFFLLLSFFLFFFLFSNG